MIFDKPLTAFASDDLTLLISDSVMEGKRIEYKQTIDLDRDEGKRKFLASIASFANASGGDIVFGMKAVDGKPAEVVPLQAFNSDATTLRMVQMIRDGIEPKVFGVEFHPVDVSDGHAFIVRIPKSYVGVHMVTFNNDNRFYARGATGRVLMDVAEIKAGFTLSEALSDKIRKWRMERIAAILADETPRNLVFPSRVVFHIMPLCAFDPLFRANLVPLRHDLQNLIPLYTIHGSITSDYEGIFCYADARGNGEADAYTLAFRNGCIETVNAAGLMGWRSQDEKQIYGEVLEARIIEFVDRAVLLMKQIGVEPPFFMALSYLNVRGFTMTVGNPYVGRAGHPVSKDHLLLPEVFLESFQFTPSDSLRESFYMVWNACGWPKSHNYDGTDTWAPGPR